MAITKSGYTRNMKNGKNDYEHRRIYEEENGIIPKGFVIHHINFDPTDNRIENLQLMTIGKHISLHNKIRIALDPSKKYFGINAGKVK